MRNVFFVVLMFLSLMSCTNREIKKNEKLISVSIAPQKYFIERIAENDFDVNVLVLPGASPETYEPLASQIKKVGQSVLYFKIGHIPFEKTWLTNIVKNNTTIKIVDLSHGISLLGGQCTHNHNLTSENTQHHHEHAAAVDPHIWSSTKNVALMAKNIYSQLIILAPEKKNIYKSNLDKFLKDIDDLETSAKEDFKYLKSREFMIYHPALSYFAKDFKLVQIPIELSGKEASPKHIKEIINIAKQKNIKTIFVQKQFSTSNSVAIAKEIDARVVVIDPLSENWLSQMKYIVSIFKDSI